MLQRQTTADGIVYYASPLLRAAGVPHAFSTRIGGISRPPFDSMNLGNPNGCAIQDDYENVWANYHRLREAAGCDGRELCRVHQVHGAGVVRARAGEAFDTSAKADAIVGDDPSRVHSVRVADCVPVLLATANGRIVAAVHAGWRGVIAGVVVAALQGLREVVADSAFSGPTDVEVLAAVGPCIGGEAFEVGPEVLAEFDREFGAEAPVRRRADGKGWADLRSAVQLQLARAGLGSDQVDMTDRCTHRDADEFFSHRRENGVTGRMAAIIAPRDDRTKTR